MGDAMYYGNIKDCDIANGPGVRVSLFVSGCRNRCPGCFQPETWDFSFGKLFDNEAEEYLISLLSKSYIRGFSLLGGEPFEPENRARLIPLLKKIKERFPDKDIWAFSGYTLEALSLDPESSEMLSFIDVLVDGRFLEELKDITLRFRGSSNQRLIDLKKTREQNSIVLWNE